MQVSDIDTQLLLAEAIERKKALNENVESKRRKNGTTLNGVVGLSAKDGRPLLRAYCRSANKPKTTYFLNGEKVDLKNDYKEYLKPYKPSSPTSTMRELGIEEEPFPLRDFKFSSIKKITIQGETYNVVE